MVKEVLGILTTLRIVLELNFDLFSIEGALIIAESMIVLLLDTFGSCRVILHLGKGKAVFRISISLGDDGLNSAAFLKKPPEFILKFFGFRLDRVRSYLAVEVGNEEFAGLLAVLGAGAVAVSTLVAGGT